MLKKDETEFELVKGGKGGMDEFALEPPFAAAAALRLELLFVFARPKPCRLEK